MFELGHGSQPGNDRIGPIRGGRAESLRAVGFHFDVRESGIDRAFGGFGIGPAFFDFKRAIDL